MGWPMISSCEILVVPALMCLPGVKGPDKIGLSGLRTWRASATSPTWNTVEYCLRVEFSKESLDIVI